MLVLMLRATVLMTSFSLLLLLLCLHLLHLLHVLHLHLPNVCDKLGNCHAVLCGVLGELLLHGLNLLRGGHLAWSGHARRRHWWSFHNASLWYCEIELWNWRGF